MNSALVALLGCLLLLSGGAAQVMAQRYRVRVYNPSRYGRTRQATTNRAAPRAALKKKQNKPAKAKHAAAKTQ